MALLSKNMARIIFMIVLIAVSGFSLATAQEAIEIKVFLDRDSGGWNDKKSDYAFLAEVDGCRIKWNAVEDKDGTRSLVVHRKCKIPFSEQAPIHLAILKKINAQTEISSFKYISWGPFCRGNDWSWCIPIAKASLESKEFIDHCRKYPKNIETVSSNNIFIKLANETNSYKPLSDIFMEFGVNIQLRTVEKVFALRLKETPFHVQLQDLDIKGNPLVMYDAGMTYFYIIKLK